MKRGRRPEGIAASAGRDLGEDLRVGHVARDGEHGRASMITGAPKGDEFVTSQGGHAFQRPGQRSSQRMTRPDGGGEKLLGHLHGLILIHQDFLADDTPFALDLDRRESGMLV